MVVLAEPRRDDPSKWLCVHDAPIACIRTCSEDYSSARRTKGSSGTQASLHPPPTPVEPIELLKSAWKPFEAGTERNPRGEISLPRIRGNVGRARRRTMDDMEGGWRLRGGQWALSVPGTPMSLGSLTTGALADHDAALQHDPMCRCELCFGSLHIPKPGSEHRFPKPQKSRQQQRWQLAMRSSYDAKDEPNWTNGLGPTEAFVRKQTLPTQHALAAGPAHALRSSSVAPNLALSTIMEHSPNAISFQDLARTEFESWYAKWSRELKFLEFQRKREEAAFKRDRPVSSCSASTRASSRSEFSVAGTRAPSDATSVHGAAYMPVAGPRTLANSSDSLGRWVAYNAAFAKQEAQIARGEGATLRAADVAWPPLNNVCGFRSEDGPRERKIKLHKALLRWHPDKWHHILEVAPNRGELATRLADVTQQILCERALA